MHVATNVTGAPRGAAGMTVAIVMGSVALLLAVSAVFLGLGALHVGDVSQGSGNVFVVADGCAEETLERIRRSASYGVGAGTIPLTLGSGSCAVTVADLGGNRRQVTVIGTMNSYRSRVQLTLTIAADGSLTVNSWIEAAA